MRLTSKGRYAVTAMLDVALHSDQRPVSLSEISSRQDISLSYLEQLFARLRRNGLVKSVRGPGGGYILAKDRKDITISQIVHAVDENVAATKCHGTTGCQGGARCLTHTLWDELSQRIDNFLSKITLQELMSNKDVLAVDVRQKQTKNSIAKKSNSKDKKD